MTTDETRDQSGNMTTERAVADARLSIADAERCQSLGIQPSHGTLIRSLRRVTTALEAALRVDFSSPVGVQLQVEGAATDEQVERAAVAICVAQEHSGDRECEHDNATARAALAAAGVAPPAPSADREKQIATAEAWLNSPTATMHGARGAIRGLIDTLAAPAPVDEAKLAEVMDEADVAYSTAEHIADSGAGPEPGPWFAWMARAVREYLDNLR